MSAFTWTEPVAGRWTLDAAPRYEVYRRGPGDYPMFIDGHEVGCVGTGDLARARLECTFEYEEHASELELARLRLRQARERLVSRFPHAARDGQLGSILEGLGDALGAGPEATEPDIAARQATDRFRQRVSPDLWIVVDASATVVFEVTTPAGRVLRRVTVSPTTVALVMGDAAMCARMDIEESEEARLRGPDEKRRAEGRLTQQEAVEWLLANVPPAANNGQPRTRGQAADMVTAMERSPGDDSLYGMKFENGYWVVPAERGPVG